MAAIDVGAGTRLGRSGAQPTQRAARSDRSARPVAVLHVFRLRHDLLFNGLLPAADRQRLGHEQFRSGLGRRCSSVVGIAAMLTGSYFADRIDDKRPGLSVLMLVCAVGWAGMGFYATTAWALFAVALVEIGIGIARPMFWTVPPVFLSRAAMAGAIALISCFANFGGIVGPVMIGWLKTTTNSFSGGLYYVAGCALIASVAILLLRTVPRMAKLGAPAR